jgi:PAS domain S-box-containing protein
MDAERRWLVTFTLAALVLLLVLSAGLSWVQREATLDLAKAQSQREVKRLAADLDQSFRLAQALLADERHAPVRTAPKEGAPAALVEALNLPFDLQRLPDDAQMPPQLSASAWWPGLARQDQGVWFLPMQWRQPENRGGHLYELRFSREAVLARFASEGLPPKGSMSLFRIEDDGATTILVRHPLIEREQGMSLQGHVATAVASAPAGVLQAKAVIDGVDRVVGFQRLSHGGQRLVVVYALPVEQVLAVWRRTLPLTVALTLLLAAAMAYGAWRLDRSLKARRRSERHFQTLTGHLLDAVVRYDRQGRVLYANAAAPSAHGLSTETMIGRTLVELGTPPAIANALADGLDRAFRTGAPEWLYLSFPGPTGIRHWESQVMREPSEPGEAPSVLVVSRDITQRHEAESQRQAAQRLFEAVFQAAPEAMSLGDWNTGRLLLVNDAFCELFGRPRESLIGQRAVDLGLWTSPSKRERLLEVLLRGEPVRNATGTSLRPDGQTIHVRYSAERVQVEGEDRLLLMFRDVTQSESDQRALARSELRFRLAAQHGQVWEWDMNDPLAAPGEEIFAALGHPAPTASAPARPVSDLVHPQDLETWHRALRRFLKGEADYRVELRARHVTGDYRWFEVRGSGQRNSAGRVTYMAGTVFDITDRKALEEAQRQTLKHLDTVANASPALAWTVDEHGRPDWLNQAWLAFTGRPTDSGHEDLWLADLHPEDLAHRSQAFSRGFDTREPYSVEYRMRRRDGVYRWLLEQGTPRHDADGRFIGFIGSCLDVSEQRQAEATASERSAMLEQVFGVLQDMLFVVDTEERFVHFRAGRQDTLLRPPEEFLGQKVGDVMPADITTRLREAMARAREHGLQEMDYRLDLPDASHHFNARLAWLPGGGQCMFLVRDTTAQQQDVQERERLNRFVLLLFRLATRFINLPVQQMDQAIDEALGDLGRFVSADRAYLFDYDFEGRTSSNTHEWCADGIAPEKPHLQNLPLDWDPGWVAAHQRGEMVYVSDVEHMPEGALRDVLLPQGIRSLMTLPLFSQGVCLGYVGLDSVRSTHVYDQEEVTLLQLFAQMLVNVQERGRAQEQLRELTEQLEQKVQERTQQLKDSVQTLQTVNRELESFTYSASHDLRTPLRGIEGFSALLLEEHAGQLNVQGREYLQRIQRATLHMSRLVSDLLTYSRLQQMTERIEPVALAACVREVVTAFHDELEARQGALAVDIPEALQVQADPRGLAIALRNLIDNALKFTPAHQAPDIRIGALAAVDGKVRLSVSDQGVGFDMRYHDRIFGMFQRLHRQDQIPGTGIGLALVHKAVERMGGQICAESAPGRGATFHIDLPAAREGGLQPP